MRILIVDDDKDLVATLDSNLKEYNVVDLAYNGEDGRYFAKTSDYDLIILDIVLPDIDGVFLCKDLRRSGVKAPILMLTGKNNLNMKVEALDAGADDYITKPFNLKELQARIRALTRRASGNSVSNLIFAGELSLDIASKVVKFKDKKINLRRKELKLLELLMRNQGKVLTREMILDHVWDSNTESVTNIVDVHIKYLRDLIDKPFGTRIIKTIHGLGYKLEA
jgi:DNA-binding response OmpR family regulator